ncbi:unnamed protein product [Sympodiomycopsis kandeliae]
MVSVESGYSLQPLLYPALPHDADVKPKSPAAVSLAVRCAEGYANNLYVGSSNGIVHHYVRSDEGSSSNPDQFILSSSKVISNSGKPIEKILVLYRIGLAAIVCESTLSWLHLPSLDPLPSNLLPTIRGVSTIVLDDEEVEDQGGIDGEGFVSLCVIKRKQAISAKIGMGKWITIKEIPISNGIVLARRRGDSLCVATTSEYSLINLTSGQIIPLGLPISQSTESPSASTRPSMLSFQNGSDPEFLITSHSQDQTLGVFVQASGDPAAKLIEWDSHPRGLTLDYPNLISLLRDDTIRIHNLETTQMEQTIQLPDLLEPRLLSSGQSTLEISSDIFDFSRYQSVVELDALDSSTESSFRDFQQIQSDPVWSGMILQSSPRKTRAIMICKNAVQCLAESVPLQDAVGLLRRGHWTRLNQLVDEEWERRELNRIANPSPQTTTATLSAMDHIYSLLSLRYLHLLDFYSATTTFLRSSLDVRLLLRLFPELWPRDSGHEQGGSVPIFSPLQDLIQYWPASIQDHIRNNLQWNYGTSDSDRLTEVDEQIEVLQECLTRRAYDMIQTVLESSRQANEPADLIDNALARLYARQGSLEKLSAFLKSSNSCDPTKIADVVREAGASWQLADLYAQRQLWDQTLETWTDLIESAPVDEHCPRDVKDVIRVLEVADRADLREKYAFWVVKRDSAAGVKLLAQASATHSSSSSTSTTQETQKAPQEILSDLRSAGATEAAFSYLEQLVLTSRQQSSELHSELCKELLDRVLTSLENESVREHYVGMTNDYTQGGYAESFAGHLALQSHSTDDETIKSSSIWDRIKFIMLIQGSNVIDIKSVLERLQEHHSKDAKDVNDEAANPSLSSLMTYERAILLGRLHQDEQALRLLAAELHDANSAEAYCLQGGVVLSPFTASQIANAMVVSSPTSSRAAQTESTAHGTSQPNHIISYAKLVSRGTKSSIKKTPRETKDKLLKLLLSIYMKGWQGGNYSYETATAHLLNTQAIHLSTLEILPLVPEHWPLKTLETFLTRNLRRNYQTRHKGLIQRHIALSRSLEVTESAWLVARSLGGVLQEEGEGEGDGDGDGDDKDGRQEVGEKALRPEDGEVDLTEDILKAALLKEQNTNQEQVASEAPRAAGVPTSKLEHDRANDGEELPT